MVLRPKRPSLDGLAYSVWLWYLLPAIIVFGFVACGGGGTQQSSPPPPSPDFRLFVTPTSVSIQAGGLAPVSISATASNGFSSQINVQASSLPAGITTSPSIVTLTPGTSQSLAFLASASATAANATVTLTGTSGTLTQSTNLALTIVSQQANSYTVPSRMRYVRTDAATLYFTWLNSNWIIYNPLTSRFFVTDPDSNRIFVLDASAEAVVGTISVPGAYGIDDTSDHATLYVGTEIGDVYAIDPASMTVTTRYPAAQIGPYGFMAYSVRVMADGRLALVGGWGGLPIYDGYQEFAIWNPIDNSISIYTTETWGAQTNIPHSVVCDPTMGNIGAFIRTPDRTKVAIAEINGNTLCEIDETTGTNNYSTVNAATWHLVFSPDGNWIVLPNVGQANVGQAIVIDAHTLAQVAQFNVAGDTSSASSFFVSPDSKTLYVPSPSIVYAYDLGTGQQIGWFPNIVVEPDGGGLEVGPVSGPDIQAIDGTGLLAGAMEEGVGFLDTTALRTGAVGSQYLNGYLNPNTGPTAGGTQVSWPAVGSITDVYFRNQRANSMSASGTVTTLTPPGVPGPADVYSLALDGGVQLLPEGFSYGPTVLEITPNAATAEGGPGVIYGYGFGPANSGTVPSDLNMTVGGKPVTFTAFDGNAYNLEIPPLPLQAAFYTIPAGAVGSAGVSVSTNAGPVTVSNGITYLPAVQQYALSGSALAQGIYDPSRDRYYFTDATAVRVFSRTEEAWLASINIPSSGSSQRLWGIALSPDGSRLAIADLSAPVIDVLNPDNPSAIKTFSVPAYFGGFVRYACGIAITNAGVVYAASYSPDGGNGYFKLDTNSGQFTDYGIHYSTDNYVRTVMTADSGTVYANFGGAIVMIDTATDKVSYAIQGPGCCSEDFELSLSANQTKLMASEYLYNLNLNAEAGYGLNLREWMNVSYVNGARLSPDGSLLFQPTTSGIDVIDGRVGILLERIALPITLSPNYDALVSDGADSVLLAITGDNGDGIAVVDLTSVPEPSPLPYEAESSSKAHLTAPGISALANHSAAPVQAVAPSQRKPVRRTVPHVTSHRLLPR